MAKHCKLLLTYVIWQNIGELWHQLEVFAINGGRKAGLEEMEILASTYQDLQRLSLFHAEHPSHPPPGRWMDHWKARIIGSFPALPFSKEIP